MLLLDMAKLLKKELYLGLIDYEKAFDFVNRAELIRHMMKQKIGSRFLRNFSNIYKETKYVAKISSTQLGNEIDTKYGVTQGKNSSATIFSFFVSDMSKELVKLDNMDFMDPFNILQLADDTIIVADKPSTFIKKMQCIFSYSDRKRQKINQKKTKYMHMSDKPKQDININGNIIIKPVNPNDGYTWLGLCITPTPDIPKILQFNINKKVNNTCKFYSWLEMNEDTPFSL